MAASSSSLLSFSFLLLLFLASASGACVWCPLQAVATLSDEISNVEEDGACGYGAMAMQLKGGGHAAAAGLRFFMGAGGCGACFQLRCTDEKLCRRGGVNVVVTDIARSNVTDFVLSQEAFLAMGRNGAAGNNLLELRTADVLYRRAPCEYENKNLSIRVEATSRHPRRLAIKFLYQGGQTDIEAVDIAQVASLRWQYMERRGRSTTWSTAAAPPGPLMLRLAVTAGYGGKWVWIERGVLPRDWAAGRVYDTGVQIGGDVIALETCRSCRRSHRTELR